MALLFHGAGGRSKTTTAMALVDGRLLYFKFGGKQWSIEWSMFSSIAFEYGISIREFKLFSGKLVGSFLVLQWFPSYFVSFTIEGSRLAYFILLRWLTNYIITLFLFSFLIIEVASWISK
jgi:hypothetical protein